MVEYITTKEALELLEKNGHSITLPTMINWISKYDLGEKVAGRWRVNKEKLEEFIKV